MKTIHFILCVSLILCAQSASSQETVVSDSAKAAVETRIKATNEQNAKLGYHWRAGVTSKSYYTPEQVRGLGGLRLNLSQEELREKIRKGHADYEEYLKTKRNSRIRKVTTGDTTYWLQWQGLVSDQEDQFTCWAHAATGASIAALHQYLTSVPGTYGIDLDEDYVVDHANGICVQYTRSFDCGVDEIQNSRARSAQGLNQFPNYNNAFYSISSYFTTETPSRALIKEKLQTSPVLAGMVHYDNLIDYPGGVYNHPNEDPPPERFHEVVIIGWGEYSEGEYWICRNSWGNGWGEKEPGTHFDEKGYFKIDMGSCGISDLIIGTVTVSQGSCLAKIVPNFQTFGNAIGGSFISDEWTYVVSSATLSSNLTIAAGRTIAFAGSTSLTSTAQLTANGNLLSHVIFKPISSTSPGSWGSIVLSGSGANNSSLTYCDIQYGTEVDVTNASGVTVQDCAITNSSSSGLVFSGSTNSNAWNNTIVNSNIYHGIIVENNSSVTCWGNTIYKSNHSQNGAGILFASTGSGLAALNDIGYYNWGIGTIWYSSPISWYSSENDGNNRITHCLYGLMVYYQSYPSMGLEDDEWTYYNSFTNNSYYAAVGTAYQDVPSGLDAYGNYWGSNPPDSSRFIKGPLAYINHDSWIGWDPWQYIPLPYGKREDVALRLNYSEIPRTENRQASIQPKTLSGNRQNSSNQSDPLLAGKRLLVQKNYVLAKDFFLSYLSQHPDNQAAYIYLFNCYSTETANDIKSFFLSLPKEADKGQKLLLAYLCLNQGDISSAKQVNSAVANENPNTVLSARAKLNNFYVSLHHENDINAATAILNEVETQAKNSTPFELSLAEHTLETYVNPVTGEMSSYKSKQNSDALGTTTPSAEGIVGNYPNPFNPSTTINYQLTVDANVTLKIYDVLGREVATLVDGMVTAGNHAAPFDGGRLSSGVYLTRLVVKHLDDTKPIVQTRKILLMK